MPRESLYGSINSKLSRTLIVKHGIPISGCQQITLPRLNEIIHVAPKYFLEFEKLFCQADIG